MEWYIVVGTYSGSFVDSKTGQSVSFAKLFLQPLELSEKIQKGVQGVYIETQKIKPDLLLEAKIKINETVAFNYDKYKNISQVIRA